MLYRPFSDATKRRALERQGSLCASCGTKIDAPGVAGQAKHKFGEWSEGHHLIPAKAGGGNDTENCVVLCRACHMSAHAGGAWSDISMYRDLRNFSMSAKINRISRLYPFYSTARGQ